MRIGECTNQQDLVAALEAAKTSRIERRRPFEAVWWNSIALVAGDHYARYDPYRAAFVDTDPNFLTTTPEDRKPRMVLNHAQTVARTELSKLTKSRPTMDVMANSDEAKDLAAAKVGMKVLEALEWLLKCRKRRKDALWWMITTGLGSTFVGYDYLDATAGSHKFTIDPTTDEPIFDKRRIEDMKAAAEAGEGPAPVEEEYPLGEIDYRVYSPFQLLPQPGKSDFDDIQELICQDVWNVDELTGVYGKAAKNLSPEEVSVGVMESRMLERMGMVPSSVGQKAEDCVQCFTWWCEPGLYRGNKYLRNGKMIRWCQGRTVLEESKAFPYMDGKLPFAWYTHIPSNLSIWPRSVMEDIREPNLEIDKTVSQLIENKDYMANPMWLIATQHRIKGGIKNRAGSIVRYTHVPNVPEPVPVQGMQMPSQVENLVVALRDQILDISGQSEVSRGKMPSGVRSGVQVAYLQEEDDTKIAPTVENMELAVSRESQMFLERVSQFYVVQRILGYYNKAHKFDVIKFKGTDLKNNTRVVPQMGSAMPKSKAARQQYTLELISLGIERDPKRIKEMLELGHGEPDATDMAESQADRENNIMLFGLDAKMFTTEEKDLQGVLTAAVPVKQWHNHDIHLARHHHVMMTEDFEELCIIHPEIARLFDEHCAMHEQVIQQQQQAQMAMLEAQKGAPDGPPTPGGPQPPQTMAQTGVPDVIGGGQTQISSRQFQDMGAGGGNGSPSPDAAGGGY